MSCAPTASIAAPSRVAAGRSLARRPHAPARPVPSRLPRADPPARVRSASDAFDLDALMPDTIEGDLEGLQEEAGAEFDDDGVPLNYGDVDAETTALDEGVGIVDRGPAWRLLRLAGPDAVPALIAAGAAEADVRSLLALAPGRGAALSFVGNDEGDGGDESGGGGATGAGAGGPAHATLHVMDGGLLIVAPATTAGRVADAAGASATRLDERCVLLTLIGPLAGDLLKSAGVVGVMEGDVGAHATFGFEGRPVVAARGGEIPEIREGVVNRVADEGVAGLLWAAMVAKGARECGTESVERVVERARARAR